MATLFDKIKKALGFYPKASYSKIETTTGEPVKVTYAPQAEPEAPVVEESISSQEAAVDTKDDGIDLTSMTKGELITFAKDRGIPGVSVRMKKQDIINTINSAI